MPEEDLEHSFTLRSPVGEKAIVITWPKTKEKREGKTQEIVETIKFVFEDFADLGLPSIVQDKILRDYDAHEYESVKAMCDRYNKALESLLQLEKGTAKPQQRLNKRASRALLRHIIHQVYSESVTEPERLNKHYEPFSSEVYGETTYERVEQILHLVNMTEDDVFIDLGSGIGNVVVHVAGASQAKISCGIEIADVPNRYAHKMETSFRKWMAWYGKKYGEFSLVKGDFLDPKFREMILSASVILVNNFAFEPELDHKLKEIFADLKDGTKIISSKAFCSLTFRITDRNLTDIGTIMEVTEMAAESESVSWTSNPVPYFYHVLDRTKLERYFQDMKLRVRNQDEESSNGNRRRRHVRQLSLEVSDNSNNRKEEDEDKNSSVSVLSVNDDMENQDESSLGPTTRRAWSSLCQKRSSSPSEEEPQSEGGVQKSKKQQTMRRSKKVLQRNSISVMSPVHEDPAAVLQSAKAKLQEIKAVESVTSTKGKKRGKGRTGRCGRPRKLPRINGLDILHSQTVLSTAGDGPIERPPPAQGCIDSKLSDYVAPPASLVFSEYNEESELERDELPSPPIEFAQDLDRFLIKLRKKMIRMHHSLSSQDFVRDVCQHITKEKAIQEKLKREEEECQRALTAAGLEVVRELKYCIGGLHDGLNSVEDMLKIPVVEQKERERILDQEQALHAEIRKEEQEVNGLKQRLHEHERYIKANYHMNGVRLDMNGYIQDHRRDYTAMSQKVYPVLPVIPNHHHMSHSETDLVSHSPGAVVNSPIMATQSAPPSGGSRRRTREPRPRKQDYPHIPKMERIQEDNPDILAQKIIQQGRQLEANRRLTSPVKKTEVDLQRVPSRGVEVPRVSYRYDDHIKSLIEHHLHDGPPVSMSPGLQFRAPPAKAPAPDPKCRYQSPDYTQVSPAKLALKRHMQEKEGFTSHHTIGDLVRGEVERTLEISSQSLIDMAVDMTYNQEGRQPSYPSPLPLKTENPTPSVIKLNCDVKKEGAQPANLYSPISRPSSAEGDGSPVLPSSSHVGLPVSDQQRGMEERVSSMFEGGIPVSSALGANLLMKTYHSHSVIGSTVQASRAPIEGLAAFLHDSVKPVVHDLSAKNGVIQVNDSMRPPTAPVSGKRSAMELLSVQPPPSPLTLEHSPPITPGTDSDLPHSSDTNDKTDGFLQQRKSADSPSSRAWEDQVTSRFNCLVHFAEVVDMEKKRRRSNDSSSPRGSRDEENGGSKNGSPAYHHDMSRSPHGPRLPDGAGNALERSPSHDQMMALKFKKMRTGDDAESKSQVPVRNGIDETFYDQHFKKKRAHVSSGVFDRGSKPHWPKGIKDWDRYQQMATPEENGSETMSPAPLPSSTTSNGTLPPPHLERHNGQSSSMPVS